MIVVKNLVKSFSNGHKVLSGIDFTAGRGEFIALLGASGSGKSTFFRCLTLYETWDQGQFKYDGQEIIPASIATKIKIRKEWAFLEQKPNINMNRTALKNVQAGRLWQTPIWRLFGHTEYYNGMDMLEKVGLLLKAHEKAGKLSGGEQQRVAIAKALVQGAKVILADEPVSGLQPEAAHQVMEQLQSLCFKEKITVISAIHQVELAEKYATRIIGLADGKFVLDVQGRRLTQREKDLVL